MSPLPTSGALLSNALTLALPWLLLVALGAVGLALALLLLRRRARRAGAAAAAAAAEGLDTLLGWAPEATRVLSLSERRAHALLVQALPAQLILAQVSLARFIKVPTRHSYAEWLRRVGHLCADLLVCDAQSQVIAVVEVRSLRKRSDERAEQGERRQQRFARVLKAAGIPLHVWVENALPSVEEVRRAILPKPTLGLAEPAPPLPDDGVETREPPTSSWFDDVDAGRTPLNAAKPPRR